MVRSYSDRQRLDVFFCTHSLSSRHMLDDEAALRRG